MAEKREIKRLWNNKLTLLVPERIFLETGRRVITCAHGVLGLHFTVK